MTLTPQIIGMDLSLKRSAAVRIPLDWTPGEDSLGWFRVEEPASRSEHRIAHVARIADALAQHVLAISTGWGPVTVFVEGYAFGAPTNREVLAELGGVVRFAIWNLRRPSIVLAEDVPPTSARKLLLGKGNATKIDVYQAVLRMLGTGSDWLTTDEADAFAVANYGLSELGGTPMMLGSSPTKKGA